MEENKKQSALGIIALICDIICCLYPFALILSLIDLIVGSKAKKHTCSVIALILSLILLAISFIGYSIMPDDEKIDTKVSTTDDIDNDIDSELVPTIEETLLYDENNLKVTLVDSYEKHGDIIFKLLLENTSDKEYTVTAHSVSVNGINTDDGIFNMHYEIGANKKTNAELEIDGDFLQMFSVKKITNIDALIWCYVDDFKSFDTEQITIYSDGSNTNTEIEGEELYNKDGIIVKKVKSKESDYKISVVNKTGKYIGLDIKNVNYNDFTDPNVNYDAFNECLLNDSEKIFNIEPDDDFIHENGIEKVENVEFSITYRPLEEYGDEHTTDTIKFSID